MAGVISGLGTTYGLPNYTGLLYQLTPSDSPFFSAIGGLGGGGQTDSTEFEWSTFDLREAGQNVALEGATAPTAQERVRGNVTNVCQVHQEKVSVSYSKLAAIGLKAGSNNAQPNNVGNELDWQVTQMLKQMVRDIEWSFINGAYQKPANNSTARKTRGLRAAITSNKSTLLAATTGLSAATDTITESATPVADGDKIVFTDVGASTAIVPGRVYYVVSKSTNAFKVAATKGGSAITIGTATVAYRKPTTALALDHINGMLQSAFDNGGISDSTQAVLLCSSAQKIALSAAYASAYGKYVESNRTVGGVNMSTITTDFGTLNAVIDRYVPADTVIAVSLDQCRAVFLETPGKGHFFAEPLAKTGASEDVQLYGEVGLAYGNEASHAMVEGLKV